MQSVSKSLTDHQWSVSSSPTIPTIMHYSNSRPMIRPPGISRSLASYKVDHHYHTSQQTSSIHVLPQWSITNSHNPVAPPARLSLSVPKLSSTCVKTIDCIVAQFPPYHPPDASFIAQMPMTNLLRSIYQDRTDFLRDSKTPARPDSSVSPLVYLYCSPFTRLRLNCGNAILSPLRYAV